MLTSFISEKIGDLYSNNDLRFVQKLFKVRSGVSPTPCSKHFVLNLHLDAYDSSFCSQNSSLSQS